MLGHMDPWVAITLALAIGLVAAVAVAVRRDRDLGRARAALDRRGAAEARRDQSSAKAHDELDDLIAGLDSGVVRLDSRLRIQTANRAADGLLGQGTGTLVGRSIMETFLDTNVEAMAQAALAEGTASAEVRLADADGPTLIIRARRAPPEGLWLVIDDVSELRRLQRIRTEFIDNLSHELRTPLTTVSLLSETLSREADAARDVIPARMRDRIAKIEIETGHLVQMVSEILDLSRIEGGGTLDRREGLDLGRLAAEHAERLRLFAERQGVNLRIEAGQGLPHVRGDAPRLGQVVVNLVHNAVKFSADGGEVTVRARAAGEEVVISVEDKGAGIPRAARDRVFERFYKVDRVRLRDGAGGGTGLGLAIARHVVEQHGGRIWLESEEGVGSTFSFAVPVAGASRT